MPESSNDDDNSNSKSDSKDSRLDSNTEETELANAASTIANALAMSPSLLARAALARSRQQLFKKSKPAPARKHQGQVSQVLQKGKGKAVRKQREFGEVYRGLRKLRSMK
jgi:hypothetical protein